MRWPQNNPMSTTQRQKLGEFLLRDSSNKLTRIRFSTNRIFRAWIQLNRAVWQKSRGEGITAAFSERGFPFFRGTTPASRPAFSFSSFPRYLVSHPARISRRWEIPSVVVLRFAWGHRPEGRQLSKDEHALPYVLRVHPALSSLGSRVATCQPRDPRTWSSHDLSSRFPTSVETSEGCRSALQFTSRTVCDEIKSWDLPELITRQTMKLPT